ncbi:LL-diaminopimelate aminotransferase [Desertibacillus haloalkaliphilus]|uniref:LL-diaminopimelate aminotransferase n=1 Tax=Desertibacillus haloalkaliphilus TaxID=1328930 RepID=UPI001C27D364|nr:LL-diaminopimelate aminotransferase [Desertibacillus haloalkaliphilus]MBU8908863.1 LL-diaminopimelate aminotransferase [Desertibacillus haloalkaliphilus]
MIKPSNKLNNLATSVFSELAAKKNEKLRQGQDMIDLSIGSPDSPPPAFVKEHLAQSVLRDDQYGYAINSTDTFNEAVCHYYKQRFDVEVATDEVLQLIGSQDGLAHIALAYLDKGDVIIAPDPGYPIYSACAHIAGAELYQVPVNESNNFKPSLDEIPADIKKRAKIMIFNYPGNPTSALADQTYFEEIVEFGLTHNILVIHDFAYCELIFDNQKPLSLLAVQDAKKTAIEFNSLSKSFNMAGARIGYVIGDPTLLQPLATIKSHLDYGVFHPIQSAAAAALTSDYQFLDEHRKTYEKRRNIFVKELHTQGWSVRTPQGGMFVWAKTPQQYTSLDFSLEAIEKGVIVTPGHAFGSEGEGYVRIALVQEEQRLQEAAKRLALLL